MSMSRSSRDLLGLSRQLSRQCPRRTAAPRRAPPHPATAPARTIASYTAPYQASAVSVLQSNVDTSSDEFRENERLMGEAMARLEQLTRAVQAGGSARAREKHIARKKMLPRDRVTALTDPGTTFMELSPLAGHELYPEADVPAGAIITVKGGTYYPITVKKHLRAQEVAKDEQTVHCLQMHILGRFRGRQPPAPVGRLFPDREHFGRIFYNQARMSSQGIPQISVVMGLCTAGGAYVPAMSDENIIVEKQGHIFLAGPPLVKAATGEEVSC
ncbi:ClpP/crotonase-like domain-containing protein [Ustulina deusta]|nr:ClpP/crotonase-like domain-containing protein [Ustulina deusta]